MDQRKKLYLMRGDYKDEWFFSGCIQAGCLYTGRESGHVWTDCSLVRLSSESQDRWMANVPPHMNLPCHRVVNQKGILAPHYVFGGREVQRALLEKEGITFLQDGSINMKEHQWHPDGFPIMGETENRSTNNDGMKEVKV